MDCNPPGSSSEYVPQPVTTSPEDWAQNPYVQIEGGFLGGLMLGVVPFAGAGQQLLDAAEVLPHGTPQARLGLAVGQIVGGVITTAGGVTGEVLGGAATVTGLGAAVGVPGIVASTGLVVGGVGNIAAGLRGLMTTGSGNSGPQALPAARGGAPKLLPQRAGPIGEISPGEVMGKTPAQIHQRAGELGLQPRGPAPMEGHGSYIDPQTKVPRIMTHTNDAVPHGHVNNPAGQRIGPSGQVVPPKSPEAHLPIQVP